jgi:Eukaryotic and archaeal DNA primase, large subunit
VDESEKMAYASQLKAAGPDVDDDEQYCKVSAPRACLLFTPLLTGVLQVKWTSVPDLVEKRRVFLKDGWAYVPSREQSSIVFQEFQTRLEQALQVIYSFFI